MKQSSKMLAMLGLASIALSANTQGTYDFKEPRKINGSYFIGNTGGFNYNFKSPNQRQKRKYARQSPQLRKKYGLKSK